MQSRTLAPVVAPAVGTAISTTISPCLAQWMLVASSLWVSSLVCGGRSGVDASGVGLVLFPEMTEIISSAWHGGVSGWYSGGIGGDPGDIGSYLLGIWGLSQAPRGVSEGQSGEYPGVFGFNLGVSAGIRGCECVDRGVPGRIRGGIRGFRGGIGGLSRGYPGLSGGYARGILGYPGISGGFRGYLWGTRGFRGVTMAPHTDTKACCVPQGNTWWTHQRILLEDLWGELRGLRESERPPWRITGGILLEYTPEKVFVGVYQGYSHPGGSHLQQ